MSSALEFGPFRLEPENRVLLRDGSPVPLTPKAFETLVVLVEWRDRVATKSDLLQRLWPEQFVEENNLAQQVFTLRKVLGDSPEGNEYIRTVPRVGYQFAAKVKTVQAGPNPAPSSPPAPDRATDEPKPQGPRRTAVFRTLAAFAVLGAAGLAWIARRAAPPADQPAMIAVLPFANMGPSAEDDYLADGITEELITEVARLDPVRLGVIARTSVMGYRERPKPVREIARELDVDYVLEGSVRQANGRLRVTAQLIETARETHVWAEAYEREISDLLRVETEIAEAVAAQLSLRLLPRARPAGPRSTGAHVAYLKGLHFWNKRDAASLRRSLELFREALDQDPSHARAHAGLAAAQARLATSADALSAREARGLAEASARRALELDPDLPEGHAALALVRCQFDWNWPECEAELRRTLALDPNYASGRHWLGEFLVQRGRFDEGIRELKAAQALDPISPSIHTNLGVAYMYAGRYDEALACLAQALEIEPRFLLAHRVKGLTLVRKGRIEEGLASLRHAREVDPGSARAAADLGYALGKTGRLAEARAVAQEMRRLDRDRPVSAYDFAVVHAGLGDREAALDQLEKAHSDRATGLRWLKVDPIFDLLRDEPRFQALRGQVGLPD